MYFSRLWSARPSHVTFSSVHVMANVGKKLLCACDSLEVTMDKMDKMDFRSGDHLRSGIICGAVQNSTSSSHVSRLGIRASLLFFG